MTASNQQASNEAEPTSKAIKTKPWYRRLWGWFKLISRFAIYTPLLLLVCLAMLIGTQFGSHIAIKLADLFVPDLELDYQSGQLNRHLALNYAAWQMSGVKVEITDLELAWNPMCLMQKQLCVEQLNGSQVNVEIDTALIGEEIDSIDSSGAETELDPNLTSGTSSTNDKSAIADTNVDRPAIVDVEPIEEENQEITLPFGITLVSGALSNVTVRVNDMDFNANQLNLSADWLSTGIRASAIYSEGLLVSIPFSNSDASSEDDEHSAHLATAETKTESKDNTQPSNTQTVQGDAQIHESEWVIANLPEVFMPIPVFVEALDIDNGDLILGTRKDHFSKLHLAGSYQQFLINIDDFNASHDYGDISLTGQMSLSHDYPMDFESSISLAHVAELPGLENQNLAITVKQGFKALKSHIVGSGQFDFTLNSTLELAQPKIPYRLTLDAKQLQWPLKTAEFSASDIKFSSQGNLDAQHVTLQTLFSSPYQPTIDVDTVFSHADNRLVFDKLHANNQALGDIVLQGSFEYGETLAWHAKAATQQVDIGQLKLDLSQPLPTSEISGPLNTHGEFNLVDNTWTIDVDDAHLNGHIMHYPLNVDGGLSMNSQWHLSSQGLNVSALQSRLFIQGEVDKVWSLNGKLSVPDLSLWRPDAKGAINADIHVSGENEHPNIGISLMAEELQALELELAKLTLNGNYKPLDNQGFIASLNLQDFRYQDLALSSIALNGQGDLNNQTILLTTQGDFVLNTDLSSEYDEDKQRLSAQVKQLTLSSQLGDVSLKSPFSAQYSLKNQAGSIAPFCLTHIGGELCSKEPTQLGLDGNAALEFVGDLGVLAKPWLPESLQWTGPATLTSKFQWSENAKPIGSVELQLQAGNIDFQATNNSDVAIGYKSVLLRSRLDEKQLMTSLSLESYDIASMDANLAINVTPDRNMQGKLSLYQINLQALAELLPELEVLEGKISSELEISGSLSEPEVSGEIALNNGSIMATANPTLLEDIDLDFIFAGKKAKIDGELKMGKGQAYVDGELDWAEQTIKGAFGIKGDNLAVIQPPLAILNVGTDLQVKFTNESFDISGDINVPSGRITIVQLPEGGVAVSKDVVFDDSLSTSEQQVSPLAVSAEVNLNVGNKLRIDGMGLTGSLQGKLELKQSPFRPPLLFGEIKVINGNYKFMGQTLDIRAGEMQFIGPIDVPNLNIEAVREIKDEDVIAGVRITGTPMKPIVNLFSSPAKEQAEILNYIVRGTGLNNTSVDQNSGLMMGAALSLSSQIGGGAIGNIGNTATGIIEKIGFSNVQLDANDDGRFAISGFIGDKLMVKYGIGVFNPGYEMTVRYYLLSQLYLETVSGTIEQSLDLYYRFDL
ncbi:translocation/assembly module TamB domain-containing protein [uncultured Shewanella sp.]|uniref:translocation/assembly module TamB domain-containing protein n=1 Tax=uncultured Shewanella sp. TaxID=173975 RepID=UPI002639622F|nr:translocation/assembly module TamB domain-containing protein [uncultured Shewanella sp.]